MIKNLYKFIGSGFLTGYVPLMPGTFGSALGLLLFFFVYQQLFVIKLLIIIIIFVLGIYLGNKFEIYYGKDPKQFTLDEFVGTWIAFLFVPNNLLWWISAFVIWRFFDIVKPFPANRAENLIGGLGIMLDDVISGMYSLIIIYIFKIVLN